MGRLNLLETSRELISFVFQLGFEFHHTKKDYLFMTKWLPKDEENKLPGYTTHYVGTLNSSRTVDTDILKALGASCLTM